MSISKDVIKRCIHDKQDEIEAENIDYIKVVIEKVLSFAPPINIC